MLRIAFLVVDDRFDKPSEIPFFGPAPSALLEGFRAFPDEIEVHVVCCTMGQEQGPRKLADNIWYHSRNVAKWGYIRSLYTGCRFAVRDMLDSIRPDLVHAQGTERWCAISGAGFKGPKVLTIHGNLEKIDAEVKMTPRHYWKLQTYLQKWTVPRYDGVACVSSHVVECIRRSAKRTWLAPNAIRSVFFTTPPSAPRRTDRIVFLNIGIFAPWKRQDRILALAKKVWQSDPRLVFRFIGGLGPGDFGQRCKTLIEEGERLGFVEFAGIRTTAEIIQEMDSAHAMIHCPAEETFGLVVAEGLARGLKFFGSAVGGVIDITRDLPGCVLRSRDDWGGLESALLDWLHGGCPMPTGLMEAIQSRYTPEIAARNHLSIYRELLAESRSANQP